MRFLLDEHISPVVARLLRERGIDAVGVSERVDLRTCSDESVLETAAREKRSVVTRNARDFRILAAQWLVDGRTHSGLVLLASPHLLRRDGIGDLVESLAGLDNAQPGGLPDSESWL